MTQRFDCWIRDGGGYYVWDYHAQIQVAYCDTLSEAEHLADEYNAEVADTEEIPRFEPAHDGVLLEEG
jgi:hypothetical protein